MSYLDRLTLGLGFVATHYLPVVVLLASAWALGWRSTRRLSFRTHLEDRIVALTCGVGGVATGFFLLAIAGRFRPGWIAAYLVGIQLVCWRSWRELWVTTVPAEAAAPKRFVALLAGLLGAALGPIVALPLYPPIEFDATMFHLPFARHVVEAQGLGFFGDLRYPVTPALQHLLYAFGMLFGDGSTANAIHVASYLLVAVFVFVWGRERFSWRAGLWAALLWLGTPAALWSGISAYVGCTLTLFMLGTFFCLERYLDCRQAPWLVTAGALAAFAAATKYHGLFAVGIVALVCGAQVIRRRDLAHVLGAGAVLGILMLPWYAYIFGHTGNPVFPFAAQIFGPSQWSFELQSTDAEEPPGWLVERVETQSVGDNLLVRRFASTDTKRLLRLPIEVLLDPEAFQGRPLNPLLVASPLLVLGLLWRSSSARYLVAMSALYGFLWSRSALDLRYLLPLVPVMAVLSGEGLDRLLVWIGARVSRGLATVVSGAATLAMVFNLAALCDGVALRYGPPPVREQARLAFAQREQPVLGAVRFHDRTAPSGSRLYGLFCENMRYYSRDPLVGDWTGPYRFVRVFRHLDDPGEAYRRLRDMDVAYLILPNTEEWRRGRLEKFEIPRPDQLAPYFEAVYADEFATLYRLAEPSQIAVVPPS